MPEPEKRKTAEKTDESRDGPLVNLSTRIPEALRNQFKIAATQKRKSMQAALQELVEQYVSLPEKVKRPR